MDAQHAPGPWSYDVGDSVVRIRDAEGARLAVTDTKRYYERHDGVDLANARLIAAAPELLEALEAARFTLWNALDHMRVDDPDSHLTMRQIDDAIAKARGETQ